VFFYGEQENAQGRREQLTTKFYFKIWIEINKIHTQFQSLTQHFIK